MILEALAISSIAETVCRSRLFKPIQKWYLLKCSYCFAHYLSLIVALIKYSTFYDFMITWFALVTLAVPGMLLIELLFNQLEEK